MNITGSRLLLVEDIKAAALYIQMGFKTHGVQCDLADSNATAIDLMRQAVQTGFPYQVVIADLNLPDGTGVNLMAWALALTDRPQLIATSAEGPDLASYQWLDTHHIPFIMKTADVNIWIREISTLTLSDHSLSDQKAAQPIEVNALQGTGQDGPFSDEMQRLQADFTQHLVQKAHCVAETENKGQMRQLLHQLIGSCTLYGLLDLAATLKKYAQALKGGSIPLNILKTKVLQALKQVQATPV